MDWYWILLIVLGGLIVLFTLWLVIARNGFIRRKNDVEEAFSTMDVYLKKRYDMIPNLVETVKGYAKHEGETLAAVIEARRLATSASTTDEKVKANNSLGSALKSLFALSESYPDLKANTNFLALQSELKNIETEIASSRKYYNACVKQFNVKVELFPSNIVAKMFAFKRYSMFEVESEEERQNVKVKF